MPVALVGLVTPMTPACDASPTMGQEIACYSTLFESWGFQLAGVFLWIPSINA